MTEGKSHVLSELAIWKLKAVASEYDIDVSDCKHKKDFVDKIAARKLTDEEIRAALEGAHKQQAEEERRPEDEVAAIGRDAEEIASRAIGPRDIPDAEDREVERYIDETMTSRPTFFEMDGAIENVYAKMVLGEYAEAVRAIREARVRSMETLSYFNIYSSAVSIRAAEEMLRRLAQAGEPIDPRLRTALAAAKKAFVGGSPRQREETLGDLEVLTLKAHDAAVTHAVEAEDELRRALAEYESFGTYTLQARQLLDVAAQARLALNFGDHSRFVNSARAEADKARESRVREIAYGLKIAAAATTEAKRAGAETASIEASLSDAKKAFEDGAFARSLELYYAAERSADAAHAEKMRAAAEPIDQRLRGLAADLSSIEAFLSEASALGMTVEEGAYYAGNARTAVSRQDPVTASKFIRLAKEFISAHQGELDKKRTQLEKTSQIDGAKCGKCGKVSLYLYPDGSSRCRECGHSFSVAPSTASSREGTQGSSRETLEQKARDRKKGH